MVDQVCQAMRCGGKVSFYQIRQRWSGSSWVTKNNEVNINLYQWYKLPRWANDHIMHPTSSHQLFWLLQGLLAVLMVLGQGIPRPFHTGYTALYSTPAKDTATFPSRRCCAVFTTYQTILYINIPTQIYLLPVQVELYRCANSVPDPPPLCLFIMVHFSKATTLLLLRTPQRCEAQSDNTTALENYYSIANANPPSYYEGYFYCLIRIIFYWIIVKINELFSKAHYSLFYPSVFIGNFYFTFSVSSLTWMRSVLLPYKAFSTIFYGSWTLTSLGSAVL